MLRALVYAVLPQGRSPRRSRVHVQAPARAGHLREIGTANGTGRRRHSAPFAAKLRRIVGARIAIRGRNVLSHNAGVASSSPAPAMIEVAGVVDVGDFVFGTDSTSNPSPTHCPSSATYGPPIDASNRWDSDGVLQIRRWSSHRMRRVRSRAHAAMPEPSEPRLRPSSRVRQLRRERSWRSMMRLRIDHVSDRTRARDEAEVWRRHSTSFVLSRREGRLR